MRTPVLLAFAVFFLSTTAAVHAKDVVVSQKDKKFSATALKVKIGDTVSFKNEDPFFHNIFSLSDAQTFDLGSFPKGQSKTVTFTKEGKVEVECAIHPEMKLVIDVAK